MKEREASELSLRGKRRRTDEKFRKGKKNKYVTRDG